MIRGKTYTYVALVPCGKKVYNRSTKKLLGFCELEKDHKGSCTHIFSDFRR